MDKSSVPLGEQVKMLDQLVCEIASELGCEPDNEAVLAKINELKEKAWQYDQLCK